MVVRLIVCVIRVPKCAPVCPVCVPFVSRLPPVSFYRYVLTIDKKTRATGAGSAACNGQYADALSK